MNQTQMNRFTVNPTRMDMPRSKFDMNHGVKTSFNVGEVIPFEVMEVLPGDTFQYRTNKIVRLQTLLTPIMDNIYLDTYYFFVPNRLVYDKWQEEMGENNDSAWLPSQNYYTPMISAPSGGWDVGTIADYFGIPTGVGNFSVNAIPFRAYALICNDWFRSENLTSPLNIPRNGSTQSGTNSGANYINDVANGGKPFIAAKLFDYFTAALPAPQKGPDVTIQFANGTTVPVYGNGMSLGLTDGKTVAGHFGVFKSTFLDYNNTTQNALKAGANAYGLNLPNQLDSVGAVPDTSYALGVTKDKTKSGLIADVGNAAMLNVNELRLAFQIQKFYEACARGGTRYIEILKAHFGVTSPDSRLQRPEYLGGNRITLNVTSVTQNSESGTTPQGTQTAYSVTGDSNGDFIHSFVEHGFIIGVMVARYHHTYQQGLNKMWTRLDRLDYYWPEFANIGELPVFNREIYLQGSTATNPVTGKNYDDEAFGYQEAWAEYRYKPSICTGEMRSTYAQSLDVWHLGDEYNALPALSDGWLREDKTNVDRVLAIPSSTSNQLFGDIWIDVTATRCMPVYSIPGLIDHH